VVAALELYLDVEATRRVRGLWKALEDEGVPTRVEMDFVGQFVGRVLWLGVVPTVDLLTHHRLVHERLTARRVEIWDLYQPGRWVPHCTISMRVPNPLMATAIRRCLEVLPLPAIVTGASVTDHANDIAHPLTP
jgi:2'-5' RNA ligase